jgi:hypothetical protein
MNGGSGKKEPRQLGEAAGAIAAVLGGEGG